MKLHSPRWPFSFCRLSSSVRICVRDHAVTHDTHILFILLESCTTHRLPIVSTSHGIVHIHWIYGIHLGAWSKYKIIGILTLSRIVCSKYIISDRISFIILSVNVCKCFTILIFLTSKYVSFRYINRN